ncbi:alpha/beta fold hydrolase, partial [Zeaxanthinibacter enoshimensis]|uniref:alpha/beta fold hydrolase n=1 Tax=Zeaxanthinibacter enoshimensis TaxID=392009 RepID=UPI0035630C7E
HGIGNAIVMGHSMGGKTAMQFACTRPEKVSKLIVADIAPKFYPPHHQEILEALKSLPLDEFESRTDADEYLSERIKDWGTRQFLLKNLSWEKDGNLGFKCNLEVLDEKYEEIGEAIGTGFTYNGPTLFLRGDRSEYISPADSDDIRKHFPKATVATIDNAGHWLHAENPKQYFDVSMNFIGEDQ